MKTYTIEEAENILKKKRKTIIKYIKNGELKASLIGNRFIITEENIIEFLNCNKFC